MIRRNSILVTRYITYLDRLVPWFGSHCHSDNSWNRERDQIPDISQPECSTEKTSAQDETTPEIAPGHDSAHQFLQGNLYTQCFEFLVRQYQHYHAIHPCFYDRDREWQSHLTRDAVSIWKDYFLKQLTRICQRWDFNFCLQEGRARRREQQREFEDFSEFSAVIPEQEDHPEASPTVAHRFGQQPDQKSGNLRIPVCNSGAVGLTPVGSVSFPLSER